MVTQVERDSYLSARARVLRAPPLLPHDMNEEATKEYAVRLNEWFIELQQVLNRSIFNMSIVEDGDAG